MLRRQHNRVIYTNLNQTNNQQQQQTDSPSVEKQMSDAFIIRQKLENGNDSARCGVGYI